MKGKNGSAAGADDVSDGSRQEGGGGGFGVDGAGLGVISFYVSRHPTDACGSNGLPLTPNTVRVCGRAQSVLRLSHPNVAEYVAAEVGAGERLFLVSEHYKRHVGHMIREGSAKSFDQVKDILHGTLKGLAYLHACGIVSRNIKPESICLTSALQPKVAQYALFHITDCGAAVDFPIGSPAYFAPSVVARGPQQRHVANPKDDVWAVGIIALELLTGQRVWSDCHVVHRSRAATGAHTTTMSADARGNRAGDSGGGKEERRGSVRGGAMAVSRVRVDVSAVCKRLYKLATRPATCGYKGPTASRSDAISYLRTFVPHTSAATFESIPDDVIAFVHACLAPTAKLRPTAGELARLPVFHSAGAVWTPQPTPALRSSRPPATIVALRQLAQPHRSTHLEGPAQRIVDEFAQREHNPLRGMPLKDVYYLWTLTGVSLERLLSTHGGEQVHPSIHRLPRLVRLGLPEIGAKKDPSFDFDDTPRTIDLSKISARLLEEGVDPFPLILTANEGIAQSAAFRSEMTKQPLAVRERNLLYQYERLVKMSRLLSGHPYTHTALSEEAAVDIPPHARARVWAALLRVGPQRIEEYEQIDKESTTDTDHQLDVDIPRCHQYDLLLSSPAGHAALKRVLKAWINTHPHLVYWQGLDSLSAPFVRLNLTNEAVAYGCLAQFVELYMPGLFEKNNTTVLNEVMAVFWQLLAYHDPDLWTHLEDMCFKPDLFAIPWFLTCYAHVFSLDKIFILWDTLLLSPSAMILCIGVAIMKQLRAQLLSFDFSECILHFGDSPDVDIDTTIQTAKDILDATPSSLLARSAVHPDHRTWDEKHVVPPLDELRNNSSPTLSVHELEEFLPDPRGQPIPPESARVVVIDTCPQKSFSYGHCNGLCINFPVQLALEDECLHAAFEDELWERTNGRPIVIVGSPRNQDAPRLARALVKCGFPRVCLLAGGLDSLRRRGLLENKDPDPVLAAVLQRIERDAAAAAARRKHTRAPPPA
ncbi:TBCK protein kinase [Salpingoeca rosetta]|uniref:TBCK protein kinase n=1 Tax=Salpingoeca rosetta (strain ATCC 50818 / BSB-021) TaxID=946362 RepID=F2UF72_SALR5|nr:TBCK protein kinase [Salpingoeca rosetta]EGD75272.1 TBCK protein kinase [Salpingoeca rosetta]|eukprot:XP_004992325.1 TBCK protein kinase [Salpingoeca rosetta]